ncbi:hypothetical protein A11A3_01797 [Alcanivorax hongdengensis A-11-3]|uniref:DUF4336 domain-containing protein n=1 Tax=Alcanivorax hongdengensis A-11-3 TaxID=1177179 RepID=L0WFT0_9GAMM|nr:DUF4336 domain-containing protein [Alcanivorax hongdengensis]EKF75564.1 hypothetical protein A11A3_01797 [Alcanivorax hongdengensis A-11-3]
MAVLSLYEPINQLKGLADDLWIADGPLTYMAMYGARIPFTTRMTVVRLGGDRLWLHSPIAYDAQLAQQLSRLGTICHLVSPNKIHYAHLQGWADHFPDARVWASPGVRERAREQGIAVRFTDDLGEQPEAAWHQELGQHIFRGSRFMDEVVFFHHQSRTLIVADLIENFSPKKVHWSLRWLLRLAGVVAPHGQAPRDFRYTFLGGKAEARASLAQLLAWQPRRILLAHGDWIEPCDPQALRHAFRWLS